MLLKAYMIWDVNRTNPKWQVEDIETGNKWVGHSVGVNCPCVLQIDGKHGLFQTICAKSVERDEYDVITIR